jgi:osmotically-inducible protein OsmY
MGFLGKLFGKKEEEKAKKSGKIAVAAAAKKKNIPPEKVGLDGQFDESGLAKRVALALDEANISDQVGLWVAQTGSTVVLKYNPDAESILSQAKQIAKGVDGATEVQTVPNS